LPTGAEALDEPLRAFPSWFLRITCDRCGKDRMINEAHMAHGEMLIRDIIDRMRHAGCGGRAIVRAVGTVHGAESARRRRRSAPGLLAAGVAGGPGGAAGAEASGARADDAVVGAVAAMR
jgi:hypothetical protein